MNNRHYLLLIWITIFFINTLPAQTDQEKLLLSSVLEDVEQRYSCHFTYANDVVATIYIKPPPPGLSFNEAIEFLQKASGLTFNIIENKLIAISKEGSNNYICGFIIDNETREPLSGVTVIATDRYTVSDELGYFKLQLTNNNATVIFSHVGFKLKKSLMADFNSDDCTNIYLIPEIEQLSEVILKSYIIKGIDKVIDGSFNINFTDFDILPGLIEPDVLHTVQSLPGILSVDETVSNINIRGGSHDQNLITWDGIKMYQSGHFFGLISIFNPLMTSQVNLIKNGTSAEFTDGVSGTIAMKSSNEINPKFQGSAGGNLINTDIFLI